jgi:hypothetical protein
MTMPVSRRGTILIVVAGISALLASLALAFLVHMRSDVEEANALVNEVQAHLMLVAGCNYIQEASRLGYDRIALPITPVTLPTTPAAQDQLFHHDEGFGWVDVRDGTMGPKDQNGYLVWMDAQGNPIPGSGADWKDLNIPANQRPVMRGLMYVENRPPFAIQQTVAQNPISTVAGTNFGIPLLVNPDPMPVADLTKASYRSDYILGDTSANAQFYVASWFRIFRETPATFIVTCGAGDTRGWSSWSEIIGSGGTNNGQPRLSMANVVEANYFNGDSTLFQTLLDSSVILYYRVEWSAAVHSAV